MAGGNFQTAFFIAFRHLFSKKKHNIVNIIAIISVVGVMAGTTALIIVLSVFNGMEDLVVRSFNTFNPDIKITRSEGKSFAIDSFPLDQIAQLPSVASVEEVVSDLVLMEYDEKQHLVELKGVSSDYPYHSKMQSLLIDGAFFLRDSTPTGCYEYGVMGSIVAGIIQLNLLSDKPIKLYYPKRLRKNLGSPTSAFQQQYLTPAGVFQSNTDYDNRYLFCSIQFARSLMDYHGEVTAVEVYARPGTSIADLQQEITTLLGDNYLVQNNFQQEALLFKTIKSEKLIIFIILSFILLVALFNIIGTMGMIIIEKREEIAILQQLGATDALVSKVFVMEGILISFVGGFCGLLLGALICLLQQQFQLITFGTNYIIDYYPVKMMGSDFLIIFATLLIVSLFVSYLPVRYLKVKSKI